MQGGLGSAQAETLVKTGSVVVEIFGDIGQFGRVAAQFSFSNPL